MKFHKLCAVFVSMVAVCSSSYLMLSEILFRNIISNSLFEAKATATVLLVIAWVISILALLVSVVHEQRG